MDKAVIRQIGRYQLLDIIGQGGMGIVYRALDGSIGRTVAIKMLHGHYAEDKDLLARFHREVRSTANLQHKNIVTVYALDDFEGFPYMVMEYLEGQSMGEMITSRRPLHLVEKIGLVCQMCEGLQYAHERNVIHRDIKPANILVLKDGTAKIVDFGIARVGMSETLTRTGQVIGSVFYMSPEQISGAPVDVRTDIYSAGVTLYQFLAGELPFKGTETDPHSTLVKILNEPIPSLSKYLTDYPIVLDEILGRAMAKNPEERYQTAEEFGYDLSRLQESIKRGMTEDFLSQAKKAIDQKDWELARQQLQEVLKFERRNNEAHELLQLVRQEIQLQQRSVQIVQLRSQAQIALAGLQYEEALECIEQGLRLDPNEPELIAFSALIKDRIERARELAEALRRGQAALYAGDLNEAKIAVRVALDIEESHTEARALEGLIEKELEERARQAQLQVFVEEARREISNRDFLSALKSLQKAQAIDPGDSNIRELLSWAARGHEQEKRRSELQRDTNEIGKLLSEDRHAEAVEACRASLERFPDEPSLLKLHELSRHQYDLLLRRRAVDEASKKARGLAEADKNDEAIEVLEQALRSFPNDPNLETLLAITRAEFENSRLEKEERERHRDALISEHRSVTSATDTQHEHFELLNAFQEGLVGKLPISHLRLLAERVANAAKGRQLSAQESIQYSTALADFKLRSTKWERDCDELDEIGKSIHEVKGSADLAYMVDRARSIAEQHGKDEEIRSRYAKVRQSTDEFNLKREAVSKQVSDLLLSMQGNQNLSSLTMIEKRIYEISSFWLEDAFIRSLVDQASVHLEEARRHKEQLLQELAQLTESLLTARSEGQIRLLEEQANMLLADSDDIDAEKAIRNLHNIAQKKLKLIEGVVSQLKELTAKVSAAQTLAEVENCDVMAQKLASQDSDTEEANDLLRRIRHSAEERKKEYGRIEITLGRLIDSATKAAGSAELDLILARCRDVLKKFPDDWRLKLLKTRLEACVSERREQLAEVAPSDELSEIDEILSSDSTVISSEAGSGEGVGQADQRAGASSQKQSERLRTVLKAVYSSAVAVGIIAVAVFFGTRKTVTIRTNPPDAVVTIDGQPCRKPCTLKLRLGKHELLAAQSGFETLNRTLTVSWSGADLPVFNMSELPKRPSALDSSPPTKPVAVIVDDAQIAVHTSTSDALVFIDGLQVGKTGVNGKYQIPISAGSHQVRVEKPGFEKDPAQTVTVAKAGKTIVSFNLRQLTATQQTKQESNLKPVDIAPIVPKVTTPAPPPVLESFVVVHAPSGAEIHIDQQVVGHSTGQPFKSKVQPGQRTVEVSLDGYQPYSKTVSVASGTEQDLVANLNPIPVPHATPDLSPTKTPSGISDDDRKQIQQLLDRYADGYSQRNVKVIGALWPSIHPDDVKIIKEFFKDHKSVSMKMHLVDAVPAGKRVTVECRQTLQYDQDGKERSHTDSITLYVVKQDAGWVIDFIPKS